MTLIILNILLNQTTNKQRALLLYIIRCNNMFNYFSNGVNKMQFLYYIITWVNVSLINAILPHFTTFMLQVRPLAVWGATLPAAPPWWTQCAPTQLASSSPQLCPRWSCLGPWSLSGSWRVLKARCCAEPTRGMSNTWGSSWWTEACLWSTAPATSSPYG